MVDIIHSELTIPSRKHLPIAYGPETTFRGYISKIAAQVSLPYKNPKTTEVERTNGSLLVRYSTSEDCLPYGRYPRLFELWACSMIKTGADCFEPETGKLHLGKSFREFLSLIGVQVGGKSLKTIKPQLERLFSCKYFIKNIADPDKSQGYQFVVAKQWNIDWIKNAKSQRGETLDNWVLLSPEYIDMLADNPVPVDLNAIAQLRKPMSLDIYCWLTKRVYRMSQVTCVSWEALYDQFGSDTKELYKFKQSFKDALAEVLEVYPNCCVFCTKDKVVIMPSETSIPTVAQTRAIEKAEERHRQPDRDTEGRWFEIRGFGKVWWCKAEFKVWEAQNHFFGEGMPDKCRVCRFDDRNVAAHGSVEP